jgi:hypothetical protein
LGSLPSRHQVPGASSSLQTSLGPNISVKRTANPLRGLSAAYLGR